MNTPQPIGTCAILVNSENKILLGKRKNSYKAGLYGLPGGRVELNEPILEAVIREIAEETGITDLDLTYVGVVRENQGEYDFIHFVFMSYIENQEPKLTEPEKCEGWQWFDQNSEFSEVVPGHLSAIHLSMNQKRLADVTNNKETLL